MFIYVMINLAFWMFLPWVLILSLLLIFYVPSSTPWVFGVLIIELTGPLIARSGMRRDVITQHADLPLSSSAFDYLYNYAPFFLAPRMTQRVAMTATKGTVVGVLGVIVLAVNSRGLSACCLAALTFLCLYYSGNWNHPFWAAQRAHFHGPRWHEWHEKLMYDEIVAALAESESDDFVGALEAVDAESEYDGE